MAIKTFKPYTPARRNMTVSAFDGVDTVSYTHLDVYKRQATD